MSYLLDTDTCIYWLRNRQSVRERVREIGWNQISICVITVAELYYGAYNSNRVTENLARARALKTERILRENKDIINMRPELFENNLIALRTLQVSEQATESGQLLNEALQVAVGVQEEMKKLQNQR